MAIEVLAPRLEEKDVSLVDLVIRHVKDEPHALTVVTGSEAIGMATNQKDALTAALPNWILHLNTRRAAPEEQIAELEAARDAVAADPSARHVVLGALPAPEDRSEVPVGLASRRSRCRSGWLGGELPSATAARSSQCRDPAVSPRSR